MSTIASEVSGAIKELIAKVPNIEEEIRRVKNAAGIRQLADIAWVYNGTGELSLQYLGQYKYDFPFGKVTRIETLGDHKEVNEQRSVGHELVYDSHPIKGEWIARELIDNRGWGTKGFGIFFNTTGKVPEELKSQCDAAGERFIRTEIEKFKTNREKAKSGAPGFKIKPDATMYGWMKRYSPDDEVFADQSNRTQAASVTASSLEKLTQIVSALVEDRLRTNPSPAAPAEPEVVPEPETEEQKLARRQAELKAKFGK